MARRFHQISATVAAVACSTAFLPLLFAQQPDNSPAVTPAPAPATTSTSTPTPTPTPFPTSPQSAAASPTGEPLDARAEENDPRDRRLRWMQEDREKARRRWERLPPEQRQKLRQNLKRWADLPPDQRAFLRQRAEMRQQRIKREVEEAIKASGLSLDSDQRAVYALRYAQERRKIEAQLRKEMQARRQPMLREMKERLKNEFSTPGPGVPAAASPTPTPATP